MADCDDDWVTVAQEGEDDEDAQLIPKKGAAPNQVSFSLNGETVTIKNPDPSRTLLDYLRYDVGLTGTKGSCRQGGCGACTVMMQGLAINACLRPVVACDGMTIVTTEGMGNVRDGYSNVQDAIAKGNGSQCGFCTPGMVMNMHSLLATKPGATPADVEKQFDGNICRCTGYRPILAAFHKLAKEQPSCGGATTAPCTQNWQGENVSEPRQASSESATWVEPTTLAELAKLISACKASKAKYRLVAGNTGHGVYPDPGVSQFIGVSKIPELAAHGRQPDGGLAVGAAVPINALIEMLTSHAKLQGQGGGGSHWDVLAEHMGKIANNQVRNVGTWAGNLALCFAHPEFQSDMATILVAAGASVQLLAADGSSSTVSVSAFLAMEDFTALVSLRLPAPTASTVLRTYKVMRRHQNAHAVVNSGFCIATSGGAQDGDANALLVTGSPVIVYGGIVPHPVRATKTEAMLVGKDWTKQATMLAAISSLESELVPDDRDSAAYRKSLIGSLFYKYWVETLGLFNVPLPANQLSAGKPYVREISSSTEDFSPGVCPAVPKMQSHRQAAGEAKYSDDNVPSVNCLFGAFVPATVASGTVASIDPSAALAMEGVVDFIDASHLGPDANVTPDIMVREGIDPGRKVFAGTSIDFHGQPVGVLLAESRQAAEAAIEKVKVQYTGVKKPIVNIDDAVAAGGAYAVAGTGRNGPTVKGDVDTAFAAAAHTAEGEVNILGQYHFHMETQTAVAVPTQADGLVMTCSTQAPSVVQSACAAAINVPQNKVVVDTVRVGGAFGGKSSNNIPLAVAVAVGAHKHRRECRMQMSIEENMRSTGKRCPFKLTYKVGCSADGHITAVSGTVYSENWQTPTEFAEDYDVPNWHVSGVECNTMTPQNTYMRAPTRLACKTMIESIVDHVAVLTGKSPEEIRALNIAKVPPKDDGVPQQLALSPPSPLGGAGRLHGPVPSGVPEIPAKMYEAIKASAGFDAMEASAVEFNKANLWRKRGVAAMPTEYSCGWGGACHHGSKVDVYPDGTILCFVSGIELGQGLYTKCAQICALTLGLEDTSLIEVMMTSTAMTPEGGGTYGSMGSGSNAWGMELACKDLKQKLNAVSRTRFAATGKPEDAPAPDGKLTNAQWMKLVTAALQAGVDLSVKSWDHDLAVSGNGYGAAVAQVELDVLTGEVQILSQDMLYDCGDSLSPEIDIGQVEGAYVVGVGHFLTEGLEYDSTTGALKTFDTWEYKPPQMLDIPIKWGTTLLKNVKNPTGFHGSKAVGEPPLLMATSVFMALKTAIYASRADAKQLGWVKLDAPATPEQVRQLLPSVSELLAA